MQIPHLQSQVAQSLLKEVVVLVVMVVIHHTIQDLVNLTMQHLKVAPEVVDLGIT